MCVCVSVAEYSRSNTLSSGPKNNPKEALCHGV